MFPILYESITAGVVPQNNGLGILSDCISCQVEQGRNDIYELTMQYPMNGIHAQELTYRRVIKAKPNFTDNPQLFRIDRIGKVMNGVFTVYCKHISYDLSGYEITSGTASSAALACVLLQNNAPGYTITTDKTTTGNFNIYEPSSVRSWFGGKTGSFLDVFGTAELKYDNFNIQFLLHAGQDRGVQIRYGKNLLELSQEIKDTLYTHVRAYWRNEDIVVLSSKISTGLTLDVPKELILDFSQDYEEQPTTAALDSKVNNYINSHNLTTPSNNITLNFVQSGELTNRVDLCDTVSVYYEALGIIRTQVKCIRTVWDVLREKYIETEFGDAKTNLADTMVAASQAISEKPSKTFLAEAIEHATKLITGNLGGALIVHDSNGDGEPDELLIMDTNDINTAVNVWRFNQAGWGHSSSGYDGPYTLAATLDGGMVANFITAGEMSANRIRTGAIISQNNQLVVDLDNGTITAPEITLQGQDVGSALDSLVQTTVETRYALSNSGSVVPSNFPLEAPTQPTEQQPYLWTRIVYTYANGQVNTSYNVSVRGANGQDGQDGAGLEIKGNYNSMAELIAAHPTGSAGDAYMVGTDLVVWNTQTNSWEDVGRIQGPSGADGLWLAIDNDDDGTNANVTYTAHLMKGLTTDATALYSAVFVWQMVNENGVTQLATGTPTITVLRDSANYGSTIRCTCIAVVDEEDLQDYSYVTITDYEGNDITIIGTNSVQLIGESAIYKPYAISAQFQVLSDEISSKVSQTDFNSLSSTVTQQGTAIQQNANAITLKANQSTVNTLSNTVSQQGTAITQNAQAITLKADTSTVNSQLGGKMATDMSNRSSSITINSGEIKFESNTVSISATNLTVTKDGQVTAKKFKARDEFSLQDASGNSRGYFKYPSTGTHFALLNNSAQEVAEMWVYNSSGRFQFKNSSQTVTIYGYGDTGNFVATGKITGGSFGPVNSSGAVSGTSLSTTGSISGSSLNVTGTITTGSILGSSLNVTGTITGRTTINLNNASGSRRGIFWVGGNDDGVLTLYNSLGNPRANIAGHTGILTLNNANGDTNIYLYGQSGDADYGGTITCYNLIKTSSRKIKTNIKPIEDTEKILKLQAVSFDFKDKEKGTDQRGFIAEDVAEVLPNLVAPETEDRPASLDYVSMIPYLQDVIKKQAKLIEDLERRISVLEQEEK